MEDPSNELEIESESQQHRLTNSPLAGEEDGTPSFFAGDDDFAWPELSSSGEIPNDNIVEITMYSVPSTPESTPNGAVSEATDEVGNLGFSEEVEEKKPNDSDVVVVSSDDDDEERENVEELSDDPEEVTDNEGLKVKFAVKASKSSSTAMECLIEVLKSMCEIDEKGNGENVDILKTVKRRGMTFPRPRGYDS